MKKVFFVFMLCCFGGVVSAQTIQNNKGVIMEEELYHNLVEIYNEDYVDLMPQEEFDIIKDNDLSQVVVDSYIEPVPGYSPYGGFFGTNYKEVRIVNNNKRVALILDWLKNPVTRSFDVLGIRFEGPALSGSGNIVFSQTYTENGVKKSSSVGTLKKTSNGFGEVFLLSTNSGLGSSISFTVTGSGTVFGTYQHATVDVIRTDALSFTTTATGLGEVLKYDERVANYYDKMPGVDVTI